MSRRERILTPIEIMLIAGIVAILAWVVAFTLDERRELRKASTCVSRLRQLHSAFSMYAVDYDGAFPSNSPQTRRYFGWEHAWPQQIAPYAKNHRAFRCPDDLSDAAPYPDSYRTLGHFSSYTLNQAIGWKHPKSVGTEMALSWSEVEAPENTLLLTDREPWHFKRSRRDTFRNVLFLNGRVSQHSDEDVRDSYWGRLGVRNK